MGALTRALQRCLPRRRPSLDLDAVAAGFTELRLDRLVEAVTLEAVYTRRGGLGSAEAQEGRGNGKQACHTRDGPAIRHEHICVIHEADGERLHVCM